VAGLALGRAHRMTLPPATSIVRPVSHDDAFEARHKVAWATSSGMPARPRVCATATCRCTSAAMTRRLRSVRMANGARPAR
jgi:hypothetical protein